MFVLVRGFGAGIRVVGSSLCFSLATLRHHFCFASGLCLSWLVFTRVSNR